VGCTLDTSGDLVDRSLWDEMGDFDPRVSTSARAQRRAALDDEGFAHVQIVASGGFTVEKIRAFEERACRRRLRCGSSLIAARTTSRPTWS
jgi:nicotinate phosphoribosyltransferase